jgi:hypothetical protein
MVYSLLKILVGVQSMSVMMKANDPSSEKNSKVEIEIHTR